MMKKTQTEGSTSTEEMTREAGKSTSTEEMTSEGQTEEAKGTTAKLFPEFVVKEEKEETSSSGGETEKGETAGEPGKKEISVEKEPSIKGNDDEKVTEYLSLEDFGGAKVKVKIDGEEKEVTFKDLIAKYQTAQYLTQKGQRVAEEFRKLQELKAELEKAKNPESPTISSAEPDDEFYNEFIKPYVEKQEHEIQTLKQTIDELRGITAPVQYQNNLKMLDAEFKKQGWNDFMKYVPKIEQRILEMPVEQQAIYDTGWGYSSLYKDIKLEEMREAVKSSAKKETAPSNVENRVKPKVVPIESGASPSSADESMSHLKSAFERATQTNRLDDWVAYLQAKGL